MSMGVATREKGECVNERSGRDKEGGQTPVSTESVPSDRPALRPQ